MRVRVALLGALIGLIVAGSADAAVRIAGDPGGRIITYVRKYEALRSSGETVIIDGMCASACTIVLGALPRERICVTQRARLGFHAAWEFGQAGRPVTNPMATRMLMAMYPADIRSWIRRRGGLKSRMIFLTGRELASMYPRCGPVEAAAR
jgi:hypothetical protein